MAVVTFHPGVPILVVMVHFSSMLFVLRSTYEFLLIAHFQRASELFGQNVKIW